MEGNFTEDGLLGESQNFTVNDEDNLQNIMDSPLFFVSFLAVVITAAILNLILAALFIGKKTLRRTTSHNLLVSLTVSDLLVASGGIAIFVTILHEVSERKFLFLCLYFVVFLTASALNLLFVSLDKFFAIAFPLRYSFYINEKTIRCMVTMTWTLVAIVGLILVIIMTHISEECTIIATHVIITIMVSAASLATLALVTINLLMYRAARRQINRLTAINVTVATSSSLKCRRRLHHQKARAGYLCFAMTAAFSVCWVPFIVSTLWVLTNHDGNETFSDISFLLILLTPALDPVFHILIRRDIRTAFRRTFYPCRLPKKDEGIIGKRVRSLTGDTTNTSLNSTPQLTTISVPEE